MLIGGGGKSRPLVALIRLCPASPKPTDFSQALKDPLLRLLSLYLGTVPDIQSLDS